MNDMLHTPRGPNAHEPLTDRVSASPMASGIFPITVIRTEATWAPKADDHFLVSAAGPFTLSA
jgi:hypothetical protein